MKSRKFLILSLMTLLALSITANAADFDWTGDFNTQAQADPVDFRARLADRFGLDDFQVITLLTIFDSPADAYIMLRFGEMQGILKKKISREQGIAVIRKYRRNKGRGWGVMAESLGVKPGSKEFSELKEGHDLYGDKKYDHVVYRVYNGENVN